MKLYVMLRSQALPRENVVDKFARFVDAIRGKPGMWSMQANAQPKLAKMHEFLSHTKLKQSFGRGYECYVTYLNRLNELPDDSSSDDTFTIEFAAEPPFDVEELVSTLGLYARAFHAYLGFVTTEELFVEAPVVDFRKKVDRIHPVNYWNKRFCRDAFGLTPSAVALAISSMVMRCKPTASDILFASTLDRHTLSSAAKMHRQIIRALKPHA